MIRYSILVPAYKSEYLAQSIDSVLAQSFQDWELIVVNDASPYDLDSIMGRFDDPRIHYYKNEKNYGLLQLVDNWNRCLNLACGEYVMCIGDDDMLLPNCLSDYNALIDKYPNRDVYHTRLLFIDEHSVVTGIQEDRPETESVYSMIWHFMQGWRQQRIGDWLFKTSSLKTKGGFVNYPCAWGSDDITAFKMAIETGVANSHVPGFLYRNHSKTISNSGSSAFEKMEAWHQIESWYHDYFFPKVHPKTDVDTLYLRLIKKKLPGWLYNKKTHDLCESMKNKKSNFFKWWKYRDHYHLTKKMIMVALFFAAKK